ncbi:MAG: 5'-deoxynucleotidase [Clostridia bacterium]|nr:5'-deoxynucleotidase [Clostridia bacterium]MBR3753672.1 5'-deoxynucleotidase [Clostridia bacterium]
MSHSFFAMFSRMKYIDRWALMRNTRKESLCEHSLEVAAIAHALAVIANERCSASLNTERAALLGIYHDMPEIITGDMPTPIKYGNPELKAAYKAVEKETASRLVSLLPDYMQDSYKGFFIKQDSDKELWKAVKAADKISALIKCIDEEKAGSREFAGAKKAVSELIDELDYEPAGIFLEEFIDAYSLNLDELQQIN